MPPIFPKMYVTYKKNNNIEYGKIRNIKMINII